jgi:hypothetical protein
MSALEKISAIGNSLLQNSPLAEVFEQLAVSISEGNKGVAHKCLDHIINIDITFFVFLYMRSIDIPIMYDVISQYSDEYPPDIIQKVDGELELLEVAIDTANPDNVDDFVRKRIKELLEVRKQKDELAQVEADFLEIQVAAEEDAARAMELGRTQAYFVKNPKEAKKFSDIGRGAQSEATEDYANDVVMPIINKIREEGIIKPARIAKELNNRGVKPSKRGKEWYPSTVTSYLKRHGL